VDTLVVDLTDVSANATRMDIFRAFLATLGSHEGSSFREGNPRGKGKFTLDGNHFQELGKEFSTQNP
jgi:hypothetical protein